MDKDKYLALSALEVAMKIKEKEITVKQLLMIVLHQIKEKEPELHCYLTLRPEDELLQEAEQIQEKIDSGRISSRLAGVPIAIKDNLCTSGLRTTCASKILENFVPTYSAEVIERVQKAGMIILGKTNMDEFAMGSTTESSAFGITRNPINPEYVPGGSSGGSCAAVAAGEAFLALGSDTGGSIRQPASHCGVTGYKPSYGLVSRYGLIAYASSLDQVGPIGKTVADCAALLDVIAGEDKKDSTSISLELEQTTEQTSDDFMGQATIQEKHQKTRPLEGLRIGLIADGLSNGVDASVASAIRNAAAVMVHLGATVEEVSFKLSEYAIPAYYVIACAEASSNLSRFDGVKYGYRAKQYDGLHDMYKKTRTTGFGAEVKRRIQLGSFALSTGYYDAYYLKAMKTRTLICQEYEEAFSKYSLLLGPVAPTTAPKLGTYEDDPIRMYLSDIYTISVNLAGLPAISLPCGIDQQGLPIGLQFIGKRR